MKRPIKQRKKMDFLFSNLGYNCLFTGSDPLMPPLDAARQLNIEERQRKLTAVRYIMFIHICIYFVINWLQGRCVIH